MNVEVFFVDKRKAFFQNVSIEGNKDNIIITKNNNQNPVIYETNTIKNISLTLL